LLQTAIQLVFQFQDRLSKDIKDTQIRVSR